MTEPIGFDLETRSADQLFLTPKDGPDPFIRIGGYTDGDEVGFTTDMPALMKRLEEAQWNYGHGILTFDHLALAFHHASNPGEWWDKITRRAVDTELLDRLDHPPMAKDTKGGSKDKYNLDTVAQRRGVPGKTDSIRDLAKQHGGYGSIPVDDPAYQAYLAGDVNAIRALINVLPNTPGNPRDDTSYRYAQREHAAASLNGRMTLNGLRVDLPLLEQRIAQGEETKAIALKVLGEDYNLPLGRFEWSGKPKEKVETWLEFTNPLTTTEGRKWMIYIWQAFGVNNPPRTDTGQLSMSAEDLRPIAESPITHPQLRHILELIMTVTTIRTVYQTVADHLVGDRVHPLIVMRQASGRSSVTSPGLTVFGKRGGRHHERDIFIPEEGQVFVSIDLSQVDMRAVAGHSQDPVYMKLFMGGHDVHSEIAAQVFGDMKRDAKGHHPRRQDAKAIGHGANYGLGANSMIEKGFDPKTVEDFFNGMRNRFPRLMAWQEEVRAEVRSGKLLDNGFGRMMRPDKYRAHTQGPALKGQGGAADILKGCGLRLGGEYRDYLKLPIHDEYLFSFPVEDTEELTRGAERAMTWKFMGVPIVCDVSEPGKSWGEVSAK
jgi:DNA polymerase-1